MQVFPIQIQSLPFVTPWGGWPVGTVSEDFFALWLPVVLSQWGSPASNHQGKCVPSPSPYLHDIELGGVGLSMAISLYQRPPSRSLPGRGCDSSLSYKPQNVLPFFVISQTLSILLGGVCVWGPSVSQPKPDWFRNRCNFFFCHYMGQVKHKKLYGPDKTVSIDQM